MNLRELKIEITNRCLLHCVHCSTDSGPNLTSFLAPSMFPGLVEQAYDLGCHEIYLSGGEPLLHPDLNYFLGTLASKGIRNKVYTTGIVRAKPPTPVDLEELEALKTEGLSDIAVSMYSARPNIHDAVTRVIGSFSATARALRNATKAGLTVEIHFVVMKNNIDELRPLVKFAVQNRVRKISLLRFVPQGRGLVSNSDLTPAVPQLVKLKKMVADLRRNYPDITLRLGSPFNFLLLGSPTPCTTGSDRMIITPKGFAYPCDALKNVALPNVDDNNALQTPLRKILSSSALFHMVQNVSVPEACTDCNQVHKCLGGCLAQRVLSCKNPYDLPDPGCLKNGSRSILGSADEAATDMSDSEEIEGLQCSI